MNAFITKFNSPHTFEELQELFENDGCTSLEALIEDSDSGYTEWSVHKNAKKDDTVFFCCGPDSIKYMNIIYAQAEMTGNTELIEYANKVRELHERYAGKIVATGFVAYEPYTLEPFLEHQHWSNPWYAQIGGVQMLENPIPLADIEKDVVLQPHTVTMLSGEQERKLHEHIRVAHGMERDFKYAPVGMFNEYLELIFATDVLWERFQMYVRQEIDGTHFGEDFFAFKRDPECIQIWRQMLDNMGGGFRLSLFAATAFELLSYEAAGHDLDAELCRCRRLMKSCNR